MLPGARCALFLLLPHMRPGKILAGILLLIFCGSLVYSVLQMVAAARFLAVKPAALRGAEPISILKPLAGLDLDLESNLRTFFEQDYPAFELLFAVREPGDPAVSVVEKLRREYAHIPAQLLVTGEPPYPNAKAFSLERMSQAAANDLVVMSDSDTRVTPNLLRTIAAEFQDSHLGVATCPYRAVPGAKFLVAPRSHRNEYRFLGKRFGCANARRHALRRRADHRCTPARPRIHRRLCARQGLPGGGFCRR
jgi:cellulose synthase/poly-beta-1,6-N-acetylglucosamine synthase-like glycosyltransferase